MDFIDEDDNVRILLYLFDQCTDTLFKLSAVFRSGDNCRQVKCNNAFVEEDRRGEMLYDKLSQPLHNCTLPDPWFTDQNRVVLLPAAKDFADTHDFLFSAYDRIEFAFSSSHGQIGAETVDYRGLGLCTGSLCRLGTPASGRRR